MTVTRTRVCYLINWRNLPKNIFFFFLLPNNAFAIQPKRTNHKIYV